KIYTAAVARLYVTSPDPAQWTYSQVWGAAVFCSDRNRNNAFFIRIIDLMASNGVIWEQELYQGFEFIKDAPYFYSFDTDDCIVALEFADDGEATVFNKKMQDRE
ncbi:WH1-domain-containing protein, partial [Backusella circina FSU 941]